MIVYIVETGLQSKFLIFREKIGLCQRLFANSRLNNISIVKSFCQFMFSAIIY